MNKAEFTRWVKKVARSYRLEMDDYDYLCDEASNLCDSDEEWDQMAKAIEEAEKIPLTPRERTMVQNRKKRDALENARIAAIAAKKFYEDMLMKSRVNVSKP